MALIVIVFLLLVAAFVFWQKEFFFPAGYQPSLQIAVVLPDNKLVQQSALREGMEQAAYDFNCELSFLAPLNPYDLTEQNELIQRALGNDPDGLILNPINLAEQEDQSAIPSKRTPLIMINSPTTDPPHGPVISPDYSVMAEQLVKRILLDLPQLERVHIIFSLEKDPTYEIKQFLLDAFSRLGVKSILLKFPDTRSKASAIDELGRSLNSISSATDAIITLDDDALNILATAITEREYSEAPPLVYAWNSISPGVDYLERGLVKVLVIDNQYTIGYVAVSQMAETLNKKETALEVNIDFALIDQDNLALIDNQHLLYPIVQ